MTDPSPVSTATANDGSADTLKTLQLFCTPGLITEIRALNCKRRATDGFKFTQFGYFDSDHLKEAAAFARQCGSQHHATGVYILLNPPVLDLLARSANKGRQADKGETTKNIEIVRRCWLLIDCDPVRFAGISSSDVELQAAEATAKAVQLYLGQAGFPQPIMAMSGNGYHLLYRIDLPTDDVGLVETVLKAIDQRFSTGAVKIDTSVHNAARITKLYGTVAKKGDPISSRPHRRSRLIGIPNVLEVTSREVLESIAGEWVQPAKATLSNANGDAINWQHPGDASRLDVDRYLSRNRIEVLGRDDSADAYRWQVTCPGEESHTTPTKPGHCIVTQEILTGKLGANCYHDTCGINGWSDFRDAVGPITNADYPSPAIFAQTKSNPKLLAAGATVRCGDRDNIGTVVADGGGQLVTVHFVSPEGQEATANIPRSELRFEDNRPVVPSGFKLNLIPSKVFAVADYKQKFLIKNVLVANQPCIMGGPHKGLKTGTMLELAISLGAGKPFLNKPEFAVVKPVDVMVLSGESGMATLQETARRIAFAKGVDLAETRIWWEDTLPKIANPEHLEALHEAIMKSKSKACLIDPAYLCLLSGDTKGRQASNVFDMGSILIGLGDVGRDTGCTISLAHHMRKNPAEPFAIPKLEELAYAGFAEFARQWILLNRRSEYRDDGRHELWLSIGGSAGHSSTWAYDVEEGVPDEQFQGRYWDVRVTSAKDAIEGKKRDKERQKENDRHSRLMENVERIMDCLRDSDQPQNKTEIKSNCALNGTTFPLAWAAILKKKVLTVTTKKGGNGKDCEYFSITKGQQDAAGLLRECPAVPMHEHSNRTGAL